MPADAAADPDPARHHGDGASPAPGIPWRRGAVGLLAVAVLCTLFIASYVAALHAPKFHGVAVAVPRSVPANVADGLARISGLAVKRVADNAAAQAAIDDRSAYATLTTGDQGALVLTVAPAASPSIAQEFTVRLRPELAKRTGSKVELRTTHALAATDPRGLVGFYTALGWVVAGYLGATVLALAFGSAPRAHRAAARLVGVAALGLVMGIAGAVIASVVGGLDDGLLGIAAVGLLTTFAVGATTVALQNLFGFVGTGVAILLFVVVGNPSAGGAAAPELLPQPWRTLGPLLPNGAATSAVRDVVYFPAASIGGALLVLAVWGAVASVVAVAAGKRRPGLSREEAEASLAGVA